VPHVHRQRGEPSPAEPDDHRQPGRGVRADAAAAAGGDGGRHHGHQVPEHRRGDPHRAPREGETGECHEHHEKVRRVNVMSTRRR